MEKIITNIKNIWKSGLLIPLAMWLMIWGTYNTDITMILAPGFPHGILDLIQGLRAFLPFIAMALAIYILVRKRLFSKKIFFTPLGLLLIFVLVGTAAAVFSKNPEMALYWSLLYGSVILVLLTFFADSNSLQRISLIANVNWIIAATISSLIIIFFLMQPGIINSLTFNFLVCTRRPFEGTWSTLSGSNILGMAETRATGLGRYAGVAAIVTFCIFLFKNHRKKLLWLIIFLFFLLTLFFSKGKTEIGAFVVAATLVLWIKYKLKTPLIFGIIFIALIGGLVVFYNIPCSNSLGFLNNFITRLNSPPDSNPSISPVPAPVLSPAPNVPITVNKSFLTLSGRTVTWASAWSLFLDSPLVGYGFQADRYLLNGQHVHNTLLQALLEAGLLGTAFFVLAFLAVIVILFRLFENPYLEKDERNFLIVLAGAFAFLCVRGITESLAYFSADWLFMVPIIAYIQCLGEKYNNVGPKKTIIFSGIKFDAIKMAEVLEKIDFWVKSESQKPHWIIATGMHGIVQAEKHTDFKYILNSADMFVPDGISLVWLARLEGCNIKKRISGADLMAEVLKNKQYKNFLYGDAEDTLNQLSEKFPEAKIEFFSPPFRDLTNEEDEGIIEKINSAKPDILWVGLGLPKQEKWIFQHKERLNAPVIIGVGAAFKFLSGKVKRAPKWIGDLGFEWLWRLITEPKVVWRRVFMDIPIFLRLVLLEFTGFKSYKD